MIYIILRSAVARNGRRRAERGEKQSPPHFYDSHFGHNSLQVKEFVYVIDAIMVISIQLGQGA
jgi:hypothetical protein